MIIKDSFRNKLWYLAHPYTADSEHQIELNVKNANVIGVRWNNTIENWVLFSILIVGSVLSLLAISVVLVKRIVESERQSMIHLLSFPPL